MSKLSSREEMREAIKSVAEQTQYLRENLHKPFNGSTKFVTIATVTGLGAFYALDRVRVTVDHPVLIEEQAEALIIHDVERLERSVGGLVTITIDEYQRGALSSFAFNFGAGSLQSSTLLQRVNGDEWEDVPNQFNRCVFAGGRKLPGLIRRRAVEAALWAQNL